MDKGFHMRKQRSYRGIILLSGLAVLAFVSAIRYIPPKSEEKESITQTSAIQETYLEKDSAVKVNLVYNCGHIKTKTMESDENLIGKTKNEISKIHPDWDIKEFTSQFLEAEQSIEAPCENHYIIMLKEDTLYVYKKNNLEEIIKEQKIDVQILPESDKKELENGIEAQTEFEVLEILESFVS